jgi:type 1 fimbriae regulatory protein FimB
VRTDKLPLFISERGQPMTRQAVNYLIRIAGESAGLKDVHPHMLRHSCGYYLANTGVDLRTRVAGRRFEGLWKKGSYPKELTEMRAAANSHFVPGSDL